MSYTVLLTTSAVADITVAKEYYNSKNEGLGKKMANEIDIALSKISDRPEVYSKRYRDIRMAKIAVFPYLIHYIVIEKERTIRVLRVFNTHQKPLWGG